MLRKVRRVETENREGEDDRRIGGKSEFEKCAQLKMERKVRPIKRPRKKSFRASFEFLGYSRILRCLYVGNLRMTVGGRSDGIDL